MGSMLRPRHGKYASVVVDLVWDYYLSTNWKQYSGASLPSFNKGIYEILAKRKNELPEKLKVKIGAMIENDFLMAYANKENMAKSLNWMDKRVNFKSAFSEAVIDIDENYEKIDELFNIFFPELISHAESHCSC